MYAAYGQYSGRFGNWGLLAGVRVESTHATYRGNLYNSDTDTNTPASQSNSYTNAFPTLQGRYYFSDELIGRLTYASGIARPGFEQITPGASISVVNRGVTVGNPTLKPTIGRNFDTTLEWYPGNGQIAALGVFGKWFDNYILLSQQIVPSYDFPGLGPGTAPLSPCKATATDPRTRMARKPSTSSSCGFCRGPGTASASARM